MLNIISNRSSHPFEAKEGQMLTLISVLCICAFIRPTQMSQNSTVTSTFSIIQKCTHCYVISPWNNEPATTVTRILIIPAFIPYFMGNPFDLRWILNGFLMIYTLHALPLDLLDVIVASLASRQLVPHWLSPTGATRFRYVKG